MNEQLVALAMQLGGKVAVAIFNAIREGKRLDTVTVVDLVGGEDLSALAQQIEDAYARAQLPPGNVVATAKGTANTDD